MITRYQWFLLKDLSRTKCQIGLLLKGNAIIHARAMIAHGWVTVLDAPETTRRPKHGLAVPGWVKITRKGRDAFCALPVPNGGS